MSQTPAYEFDVVVIGSGPGGYVAAIRAAQLGARVACVEKKASEWGGTCLNWGCIPTKALIASVERLTAVREAARMGVTTGEVGFDFTKITDRKDKVVSTLRGGVEALLKSNHVERVLGLARLSGANTVRVTAADGAVRDLTTRNVIVATGGEPIRPPIPGLEGDGVWTSNEAVRTTTVPASILLIGGGAIGLEFAYVFNALGAKCTVVEMMPEILPLADSDVSSELRKCLTRQGIQFKLETKVVKADRTADGFSVTVESAKGAEVVQAAVVLVGVGRRPVTRDLGLEEVGIELNRGAIVVNDQMQTNVAGVYAIGDVTGKYLLAHVASHQGIVAAENAMGHTAKMSYHAVPSPVFTEPELATVGLSEAQARDAGHDVVVGKFPFRPLGKAMAMGQQDGLVKVISERKYGEVLGVQMVGPHASDLIHEAVAAMNLEATVDELTNMIHAHPTLAEAILEASLDVKGAAIHKMRS